MHGNWRERKKDSMTKHNPEKLCSFSTDQPLLFKSTQTGDSVKLKYHTCNCCALVMEKKLDQYSAWLNFISFGEQETLAFKNNSPPVDIPAASESIEILNKIQHSHLH